MAVMIVMPKLGMVMSEGTIAKWTKASGEAVSQGDVIAEIETEKINYELEATESGLLHRIVDEGAVVLVNGLVGYILAEGEGVPEALPEPAAAPRAARRPARRGPARPSPAGAPVKSTPGARTLAAKLDIDIAQVAATGPGGRIVEEDVRKHAAQKSAGTSPPAPMPVGMPSPSSTAQLAGIRKRIADHMRGGLAATAQLTFNLELDVTDAQQMRKEHTDGSEVTISIAHVLMKACGEALKRHPQMNTVLVNGEVNYFDEINIGVAVALREGLIVPVVKQVDNKSLADIAKETTGLADKSRDGSLSPDDLAGGTFTISVLGTVDGFTPILNAGQSAIMGVGRSLEKPVVRRGEIVVREMMTLSLTVDHQVIDGAVAAEFMRRLKQLVERPAALFK